MYRWIKVAFPILALLISAVVTFPTSVPAHKGHAYLVTGEEGSAITWDAFMTAGNHKGTSYKPDQELLPVTVTLTFADDLLPTSHPTFACSPRDPTDGGEQKLDGDLNPEPGVIRDHEWGFHHMSIRKGLLEIRFLLWVACDLDGDGTKESHDQFQLDISFIDPAQKDGVGTYTSTMNPPTKAIITLIHFAEKVNLDRPPGPKKTSHNGHNPFFSQAFFDMTIDVAKP